MKHCSCGSLKRYLDCCGLYLEKKQKPSTPEALMRSRYSAFVEGKADYIRKTMKRSALFKFNKKEFLQRREEWQDLQVIKTYLHENDPNIGYVEFIANYKVDGVFGKLQELSEFHCIEGVWYYVDGIHSPYTSEGCFGQNDKR